MKFKSLVASLAMMSVSTFVFANVSFSFAGSPSSDASTQVIFMSDANSFTDSASEIDYETKGQLSELIKLNEFDGSLGSTLHLQMIAGFDDLLVVGTKDEDGLDSAELQNLGGIIASSLNSKMQDRIVNIAIENLETAIDSPSAYIALGYDLRHYSFDKYKSAKNTGKSTVTFVTDDAKIAQANYANDLMHLADGVHMARDFASEPGKNLYPEEFVNRVKAQFRGIKNVEIEVFDASDIQKMKMGALMGVGKGSIHDPRLLVIEYKGGDRSEAPIALAGKGVTFDTGGISLKRNTGMWQMKSDLSGAAAVAGTLYSIAKRGESINVVGIMPLAENMPSQDAIRPGDVLQTMQGTSIEIISTDAEGRLLLADAVYYVQQEYKPRLLLNIATLTGSAARALSDEYAALITRDFDLSLKMMDVGKRSGELVWPLPLHPNHFEQIKSPIADIKNSGAGNPGASIGAAVVGTFVDQTLPWVHLDIAGVDWLDSAIDIAPKGSQGWGVRFMDQLIRDQASE